MSFAPFIFLALFVLAAGLLLREFATVARAHAPSQTRVVFVGDSAPACKAQIPRVIWTYAQPTPPTQFVQACIANWRRFVPDHEVRVLDRASIAAWLPELRADFDALTARQQTEWLRVRLLARHGGVWMDAATLLSRDLAWLHDLRAHRQADYVGFYIDRDTKRPELPLIDTGLMASVTGGGFVTALADAFDRALDAGAEVLLQRLRDEGRLAAVVQGRANGAAGDHLLQVVAADELDRAPQAHRLALLRAEDGPQAWLAAVGWRTRHHYARIALTHAPTRLPALVTLRDREHAMTARHWLKRRWLAGSALIELLGKPHEHR
ncbi:glycosyltransferase family 32 protein [Roseateles sp. DC23W]|uniref:Glycosyltransferase family 32 protein n=1 Tax=Pelomonas dachongensis TaxID=3299029 RepID=A0ABW7EIF4_9BURK